MLEIGFKWIPTYENRYSINNIGIVKSHYYKVQTGINAGLFKMRNSPKELKLSPMRTGYLSIALWKDGKFKRCTIHRLVALTFIENPFNKGLVNHKNGIKTDNSVDNLEWCTVTENINHAFKTGLMRGKRGINSSKTLLTEDKVMAIFNYRGTIPETASFFNVTYNIVRCIKTGRTWSDVTKKQLIPITYKKISNEQVLSIFNDKRKYSEISNDYGISLKRISSIKTGSKYSKITGKIFNPSKRIH